MNHLNKILSIFVILYLLTSCASNISKSIVQDINLISIEKPNLSYNLNNQAQTINVLLNDTQGSQEEEFINGLLVNYFYFKKQIDYSPKINFLNTRDIKLTNCSSPSNSNSFSIIFFTDEFLENLGKACANRLMKLKGLVINTSKKLNFNNQIQSVINLDQQKEYKDLLNYAKNKGSLNSIIIDDGKTQDKDRIKKIWTDLDGNVLDSSTYESSANNNLLSKILLIDNSKERARKLSRVLSSPIESTPRRRLDVDSIILSVSLENARSLRPELEFNFGESISVYLLPNWKNEDVYLNTELDLEKVLLIDLPWMLNPEISYVKNLPEKRNRFFALGYDSYDLTLLLNNNKTSIQQKFLGMSGKIIVKNKKISRESLKVEVNQGMFLIKNN